MGIIKKTKSVEILLKEFNEHSEATSISALSERLGSKLNKTTIYRTLSKLEKYDIVHSFMDKKGVKWYAKNNDYHTPECNKPHPHFQCQACGKIDCLPTNIPLPEIPNYKVEYVNVFLIGTCKDCSDK